MWDPGQYLRYADERARPFFDLIARVGATDPRRVADLGCGPGNLTAALADRWPTAQVVGGEGAAALPVEVPGQPGDPAQHVQRPDVQVRPLPAPRGDEVVDLVAHFRAVIREPHASSISLDIKMLDGL